MIKRPNDRPFVKRSISMLGMVGNPFNYKRNLSSLCKGGKKSEIESHDLQKIIMTQRDVDLRRNEAFNHIFMPTTPIPISSVMPLGHVRLIL